VESMVCKIWSTMFGESVNIAKVA